MKVSEVIGRTIEVIEERGWTTGTWGLHESASEVCLEGALALAEDKVKEFTTHNEALSVVINTGGLSEWVNTECAASRAIRNHLNLGSTDLCAWNDATVVEIVSPPEAIPYGVSKPMHTQKEVLAMLREVQRIEAARERLEEMAVVAAAEAAVAEVEPVTV